jgi:GntR family transcriptional regulator
MSMILRIDTAADRPLYLQIVDGVRRELVQGTLAPGDGLPSVRQLAEELRLNPNTVQQAYRELEHAGLVAVRRGQGTYVRDDVDVRGQRAPVVARIAREALAAAARAGVTGEELIGALERELERQPMVEGEA